PYAVHRPCGVVRRGHGRFLACILPRRVLTAAAGNGEPGDWLRVASRWIARRWLGPPLAQTTKSGNHQHEDTTRPSWIIPGPDRQPARTPEAATSDVSESEGQI